MQLTMTGEYAIRAMLHLASLQFGTVAQISEVSRSWDIPENFLRKISAQLTNAGLVASQRGLGGGITLGRPAEVITLFDIIEAVEGKISLNKCLMCDAACPRDSWCAVHLVWCEAQAKLKEVLSSKSLAQLALQSVERRAAVKDNHSAVPIPNTK
jgi:Rrf2 family protein